MMNMGVNVMDYTEGKYYYELQKSYTAVFQKYGFVVSKLEEDPYSLMVEGPGQLGAFTIREDGLCAGAMYPAFLYPDLMSGFRKEYDRRPESYKPRLGWFFYEKLRELEYGRGNHDFSIGEIEMMLRSDAERAAL